jgi:hypothetical protein
MNRRSVLKASAALLLMPLMRPLARFLPKPPAIPVPEIPALPEPGPYTIPSEWVEAMKNVAFIAGPRYEITLYDDDEGLNCRSRKVSEGYVVYNDGRIVNFDKEE